MSKLSKQKAKTMPTPLQTAKRMAQDRAADALKASQAIFKSADTMLRRGMRGMKKSGRKPKNNPLSGYEAEMNKKNSVFGKGFGQ